MQEHDEQGSSDSSVDDGPAAALLERAADQNGALSVIETDALTDFFLGAGATDRLRPGESTPDGKGLKTLAVNISPDEETANPREQEFKIRAVSWEEWQEALKLGLKKNGQGIEESDDMATASVLVAYATVSPDLTKILKGVRDRGGEVKDTAALLRDFFRFQPGQLMQLQSRILRMSRLSLSSNSVREVDAAKT